MPKRAEHDFAVNAFRVVEQAIGEHMDGTPLEASDRIRPPKEVKPSASSRGHARAAKLIPKKRQEIARKAAKARWNST
jgi:hypothetical protein